MDLPAGSSDRVWLHAYPPGIPASIDAELARTDTLNQILLQSLERFADRPAFTSVGVSITYAEFGRLARAFGAWLHAAGIRKGDRVALMMPNCLQYPICLLGTLMAGAIVVNVNPLYTARELAHQIRDSDAETIVIMENFAHTLQKVLPRTGIRRILVTAMGDLLGPKGVLVNLMIRHVARLVPAYSLPGAQRLRRALRAGGRRPFTPAKVGPDDIAFLQYTGGTTGTPKGAMLTQRNMAANMLQTQAWIGQQLERGKEVNLTLLPLYHIFSLMVNCFVFIGIGGRSILIANPRDVPRVMKTIRDEPITSIVGLNTLFNSFMENEAFRAFDFSHLKLTVAGGMATQKAIAERWRQITGRPITEGYGLTETAPVVSTNPIDIAHPERVPFTGSVGLPLPSTDVRLRRVDGSWASPGESGEVCVRGPQVMKGYWQQPAETARVLDREGWLATGDIGVMDERGFLRLIDRAKDMILVSGFNVYPTEIEDVIMLHPGVREVAALGVPDPVAGERVKVIVVPREPTLTEQDILDHSRQNLTGYKVPHVVELRAEELPKSNIGKLLRRALREEEKQKTRGLGDGQADGA